MIWRNLQVQIKYGLTDALSSEYNDYPIFILGVLSVPLEASRGELT